MLEIYAFTFSWLTIVIVFAMSAFGKLLDMRSFEQSITKFRLAPKSWSRSISWIFVLSELLVIVLLTVGWATAGFGLAAMLLVCFSTVLMSVLVRRLDVSCNCFGKSRHPVSFYDVIRNAGFLACALGGVALRPGPISVLDTFLLGLISATWIMLLINLSYIVMLVHLQRPESKLTDE
jgi:hypothetical protein